MSLVLSNLLGRLLNVQFFTSSGTYTPSPGAKKIIVLLGGGGGGGADQTNSGSAGGSSSFGGSFSCSGGGGGGRSNTSGGAYGLVITSGSATGADFSFSSNTLFSRLPNSFFGFSAGGGFSGAISTIVFTQGGSGGLGIKVVNNPSTETVTIGAGGAGATSGANGAGGFCIVLEFT